MCFPGARDVLCVLLGLAAGYYLFCASAPAAPLAGAWAVAADVAWAAVRAALNLLPPETYAAAWRMLQS